MKKKYDKIGHIFDRTIEECAEVIHIICKIQRFGISNYHPKDKKKTPNWSLLYDEIEDLEHRFYEMKKHIANELIRNANSKD